MSNDTNPEVTITPPVDPSTQATDILDAERKGLNDPEDATPDHGDEDPDDFDPDFEEEEEIDPDEDDDLFPVELDDNTEGNQNAGND